MRTTTFGTLELTRLPTSFRLATVLVVELLVVSALGSAHLLPSWLLEAARLFLAL